jgi:hypothetical protein
MKKFTLILLAAILIQNSAIATHSIGGDITVKHLNGLSYKITFTYYQRIGPADRDTIGFNISDSLSGFSQSLTVPFSSDIYVSADIEKRIYDTIFTFPIVGDYVISVEDPNRTDGISNIPNSVNVPFFDKCLFHVDSSNSSPVFLNDPIIYAQQGIPFTYNALPYDENDDSLTWSIDVPLSSGGAPILGYTLPSSDFVIDSVTGQVSFLPLDTGKFCFVVKVNEFRNNIFIGCIRRDMLVYVIASSNNTFTSAHNSNFAQSQDEYYRIPFNHTFNFNFSISDPDPVLISNGGNGEPLITNNPATFTHTDGNSNAQASFNWTTTNANFRIHPYLFAFRTLDVSANDSFYLDYSLAMKVMDVTYGINELTNDNSIYTYPNPSNGNFTLTYHLNNNPKASFQILDVTGRKVYATNIIGTDGTQNISISGLSIGIYYWEMISNNGIEGKGKIAVMR